MEFALFLEFGDGFDRITRNRDFDISSVELVDRAGGAGKGAVAFFFETDAEAVRAFVRMVS